jgi:hypothetical protein
MTNEVVELGHAEALIEIGPFIDWEEMMDKYDNGAAPYVEFE